MTDDPRPASTTPPVVYDRRHAQGYSKRTRAVLPPGATPVEEARQDPGVTPVVLVHGTNGRPAADWFSLAPLASNAGLPVFAFTWSRTDTAGAASATEQHVDELARFVEGIADRTGSPTVDLVGHSWGAVLARALARRAHPAPDSVAPATTTWRIRHLVGLAPTYAGTTFLGLARHSDHPRGRRARAFLDAKLPTWREQHAGSEFLVRLADPRLDAHDDHVTYTTVVTRYDQVVTPYRAALPAEPRARHIVLQDRNPLDFSDHLAITHNATALWHVMRTLAPAQAGRRPGGLVVPLRGGPLTREARTTRPTQEQM